MKVKIEKKNLSTQKMTNIEIRLKIFDLKRQIGRNVKFDDNDILNV